MNENDKGGKGENIGECEHIPRASSSSTSTSCSAAILNKAVTLYLLVVRFVRRLDAGGELGRS